MQYIDSYYNNNIVWHNHNDVFYGGYGYDILVGPRKPDKKTVITERKLQYRFFLHLHPYVRELIQKLIQKGIKGLQDADTEKENGQYKLYKEFFDAAYAPSELVPNTEASPHPVKELDFHYSGAYSAYNWELFYHVPLTVATHLSKNQRFEEAQRWLHYIFDPTDDSDESTPERFWKVKPFQTTDIQLIEDILVNLSSGENEVLQKDTVNSIGRWKDNPFRPHVVARFRPTAYMFKAVMTYLDNLIAWGDFLFRQDSIETINEATQFYVLAANILGPKPQAVPKKGSVRPQTYANLREDLDEFGGVLREMEVEIPHDLMPHPKDGLANDKIVTLKSIGTSLYFCIPRNDRLIKYWDTVADRLYKIHNSLNIQGVFRQLPLFQPPIDPALLARATAAGLDIGAAINGLNQPLPLVRFRLLVQKAMEVVQNVRSMGSDLLSNIEKEDNEAIALIRAKHERGILESIESARYAQWQEAKKNREGLEKSLLSASFRYIYYERLLGVEEGDITIPALENISKESLDDLDFDMDVEQIVGRDIEVEINSDLDSLTGGKKINPNEAVQLSKLEDADNSRNKASTYNKIGGILAVIPNFSGEIEPFGIGMSISFGGSNLAASMTAVANFHNSNSAGDTHKASRASTIGGYDRREQDWALQSNLAAKEINQINTQIIAAQIREYITEKEWRNHKAQIKNAKEVEAFLQGEKIEQLKKTSTKGFYAYMKRESRALYNQYFQLAFEVAKKAERALQQELGKSEVTFLKFDYLAGKEGLYAGEKLALDLQRMEMAYYDLNIRELELTKHISIRQLDPMALLQLKTTGKCTISLPEEIFDMGGCEGHYFRRTRSVGISIPCITGPYIGVNCTLTLTKSTIRKSDALLDGEYRRQDGESERFSDNFSSIESIVTSTAQNDSGLFDSNGNDERKLPFEYAGVISEWQLELPNEFRLFDYNTITDVIFHIRYTARLGGGLLKEKAIENLNNLITTNGNGRLFSLKNEFPNEWHKFTSETIDAENPRAKLSINLSETHYPYWSTGRVKESVKLEFYAVSSGAITFYELPQPPTPGTGGEDKNFKVDVSLYDDAMKYGEWEGFDSPPPLGQFNLFADNNTIDELWLFLTWKDE